MYQFSYRSLAKQLGCSTSTLHKSMAVLKSQGLVRPHSKNNNLVFLGYKALMRLEGVGYCRLLKVKTDDKILLRLKNALLNENIESQLYNIEKKEKEEFLKQKGSRKKKLNKPETSPSFCDYAGLSLNGIAGLYKSKLKKGNIHSSTARRLKRKLRDAGLIVSENKYKVIETGFTLEMFQAYRDLHNDFSLCFFRKQGLVTRRAHDKITIAA